VLLLPSTDSCELISQRPLEVLGKPISKQIFNRVANNIDHLVANYAYKVRFMQTQIAKLTQLEVDLLYLKALQDNDPHSAYKAYAWLQTCKPFSMAARAHRVNTSRLTEVFKEHPDFLYRYGLFFRNEPDKEVHDRLAGLHGPTAGLYWQHCILQRVAVIEGYDLRQLRNW
jgi:hypothetical protein